MAFDYKTNIGSESTRLEIILREISPDALFTIKHTPDSKYDFVLEDRSPNTINSFEGTILDDLRNMVLRMDNVLILTSAVPLDSPIFKPKSNGKLSHEIKRC